MNLRQLLPYDQFVLWTRFSDREAIRRLQTMIRSDEGPFAPLKKHYVDKAYEGELSSTDFTMRPRTKRKPLHPQIRGTIQSTPGQTLIHINIRPTTLSILRSCFVNGLMFILCFSALKDYITTPAPASNASPALAATVLCIVLPFVVLHHYLSFWSTAKKAKMDITHVLQATEAPLQPPKKIPGCR